MKKILIIFLLLIGICSCVDSSKSSSGKTYVGNITNKATFEKYLSYSSSYIEQGNSSTGYYVVITVNVTSLNSNYYFEDLQFSIKGDKSTSKKYSVPTNGSLVVTCNSMSYSSRDSRAYFLMTLEAGQIKMVSGKVYKTN